MAEFYDYVAPYRERQDVAFFVQMARDSGGPVLEIGCGTGRVLIPTAQAATEIVGLDASPAMLARCREKLSREPQAVQSRAKLVEADMRHFDLARLPGVRPSFALATVPFRPAQHLLTVEDQLACLASIHRHLAARGRLGEEPEFTLPDGRRVRRTNRIVSRDGFNQIQGIELIYHVTHPEGREERLVHAFQMRYFFRFELDH